VTNVRWPGRPGDPAYEIALRQMRRGPGIVTFELASKARGGAFLTACRLVTPAASFGGPHTTAARRAPSGGGTPGGPVRLSCGVEDTPDLIADIKGGFPF